MYYKDLEQAKQKLLISDYIEKLGCRLEGKFYNPCPLCGRKNHFYIYSGQNRFAAFGCGKHGSIVDLISCYENITVKEAIIQVLERTNSSKESFSTNKRKYKDFSYEEAMNIFSLTYGQLCEIYKTSKELKEFFSIHSFEYKTLDFLESYADRMTRKLNLLDLKDKNSLDKMFKEAKIFEYVQLIFNYELKEFIKYLKENDFIPDEGDFNNHNVLFRNL